MKWCSRSVAGGIAFVVRRQLRLVTPRRTQSLTAAAHTRTNDESRITFRNATNDDIPTLLHWDEQPHIQAVMGDYDFNEWNWASEIPRTPPWRQQWVAQISSSLRPIGFVQIIDALEEETHYWGHDVEKNIAAVDIWIGEPDCLGKGYGSEMMDQVFEFCFATWNVKAVVVDPMHDNLAAHRFYEKCGMKPIAYKWFGPDKCLIHRIDSNTWWERRAEKLDA